MSDSTSSSRDSWVVEGGPVALAKRTFRGLYRRLGTPTYWYWRARGEMPLTVGDHTVSVSISRYLGDYRQANFLRENEADELADVLAELEADDVFLDVGANIGVYSLFADEVADSVYAIEPHPVNSTHLLINKRKNRADVDVYACALSDGERYVEIAGPRGGFLADGSVALTRHAIPSKEGPGDRSNELLVRAERGDELLERESLATPTVVKIDVEGEEGRVIDGLADTLEHSECRLVYCEVHEGRADYDAIDAALDEMGFATEVIDEREYGTTIKATA